MSDFFASGRLVDLILLIVALEAVVLTIWWTKTGKGIAPRDLLPNLIAGALLLLALRLTLVDAGWMPICACLAASGIANVVDITRRWRG